MGHCVGCHSKRYLEVSVSQEPELQEPSSSSTYNSYHSPSVQAPHHSNLAIPLD